MVGFFPRGLFWAALAAVTIVFAGCGALVARPTPQFSEVLLQGEGRDKLLMIDITGIISNAPVLVPQIGLIPGMTARIRQELEIAFEDPAIRGILLRINSPGGTLTDSDVIYHSLLEFKKAKKVKILASLGEVAASGGLYVAMAADEIYAHPTTITGSVGVILPHMNYTGLMKKFGVKNDPILSGKFKDIDSPFRERTEEERKMLQALIDHQHGKFVAAIQAGRSKMTRAEILELADGRLMSAAAAKKAGLIDEIGYLDDALKRLTKISGFRPNRLVRYANTWRTGNNIYSNTFPVEMIAP